MKKIPYHKKLTGGTERYFDLLERLFAFGRTPGALVQSPRQQRGGFPRRPLALADAEDKAAP